MSTSTMMREIPPFEKAHALTLCRLNLCTESQNALMFESPLWKKLREPIHEQAAIQVSTRIQVELIYGVYLAQPPVSVSSRQVE